MFGFFLGVTGIIFTGYGGYLLVSPQYIIDLLALGEAAPMLIEVRAMYGGLQMGIGLLMLWSAIRRNPQEQRMAFATLIVCFGGLALGRGIGLFMEGGDTYNLSAFIYESASLLISVYGFARLSAQVQASG